MFGDWQPCKLALKSKLINIYVLEKHKREYADSKADDRYNGADNRDGPFC